MLKMIFAHDDVLLWTGLWAACLEFAKCVLDELEELLRGNPSAANHLKYWNDEILTTVIAKHGRK